MSSCSGKKSNYTCNATLYKCKKCGNVGCDQYDAGKCTNQGFKAGACTKCNSREKSTF